MKGANGSRRRRGGTLLEALLAAALLVLLLAGAGALLAGASRAGGAARQDAARDGAARLAGELLRAELELAGSDPDASGRWSGRPALEVGPARTGDRIVARYVDPVAGPVEVRYEAGRDRAGRSALYRSEPGAARQPAVAGVRLLRVLELGPPLRLELELDGGGRRRVVVAAPAAAGRP